MQRSSPRARAGLSRFAAFIAPSAAPAPTMVWISSMKRMIWPAGALDLLQHGLEAVLELAADISPRRRARPGRARPRCLFLSDSGTSPRTMRWAMPSTIAVLPTPGSPMSTGLFFVRRESTCMTRRISSSRPMTGSTLALSRELGEIAAVLLERLELALGILSVTRWVPRTPASAARSLSYFTPPTPRRAPWMSRSALREREDQARPRRSRP